MSSRDRLGVVGSIRLGVSPIVAATLLLVAATLATWAVADHRYDRSTAVATGTVVDVLGDAALEVTVAWTSAAARVQRLPTPSATRASASRSTSTVRTRLILPPAEARLEAGGEVTAGSATGR